MLLAVDHVFICVENPHAAEDWDGAKSGEFHDFRPTVPLVLRW